VRRFRTTTQNPQRTHRSAWSAVSVLIVAAIAASACGKSGPPLPPLVKLPVAPGELVAERRGETVDIHFVVPAANTDGTRPANIQRVEVYAITGAPATMPDAQLLKRGVKVASVDVKAPKDPDAAADPDDPSDEIELPEGTGLDQGVVARVSETLSPAAMAPVDLTKDPDTRKSRDAAASADRVLLAPSPEALSRVYAGVGIATNGRKGIVSKRVVVPLTPPPPALFQKSMSSTEKAITLTWTPVTAAGMVQAPASDGVLPATPIGIDVPTLAYNVYDVSPREPAADAAPPRAPFATKLTDKPLADPMFEDTRMTWGARRCYTVRVVETVRGLPIESDPAPAACDTLKDTFPPAVPKGLQTVAGEGTINLIWEPNAEPDLAGYVVLRGATATALAPVTPAPIVDSRFTDTVAPGSRFFYAVEAVDKAGNVSAASPAVPETAR